MIRAEALVLVLVWGGCACAWAQSERSNAGSVKPQSSTAGHVVNKTTGSVRTEVAQGEVLGVLVSYKADRVVLARTARIKPGKPLTLGDIAKLEGSQAAVLGGLVVAEHPEAEPTDAGGWFAISLDRVCSLIAGTLGERAAMIDCSGSSCDVRIVNGESHIQSQEPTNKKADIPARVPTADMYARQATVRGAIAREVARVLGIKTADLRLTFADRDAALLAISTTGRVVEVSPTGSSDRMPILVAVYGPSGPIVRQTVRVEVQIRRVVAVVSREIARGKSLDRGVIVSGVRWLGPTDSTVEPEAAIGLVARHRLLAGDVVEARDIEPPIVIHRGDLVSVRVSMRGVIVMREARALDAGRQGEEILFAAKKDPRQHFKAKVVGPGEAMIWGGLQRGMSLAKNPVRP